VGGDVCEIGRDGSHGGRGEGHEEKIASHGETGDRGGKEMAALMEGSVEVMAID